MEASLKANLTLEFNLQDVFFADAQASPIAPQTWHDWLQTWLETLQTDIPPADAYEISLRLTNDAEIQSLNAQYRQKNQPTDVLAFAALEIDSPQPSAEISSLEPLYLGDLIISVETAARQAQQQRHSLARELAWLASHGFLHLLGWDHPEEESLQQMLAQQETLLRMVGMGMEI
jgi:probable rRNA maturation factor